MVLPSAASRREASRSDARSQRRLPRADARQIVASPVSLRARKAAATHPGSEGASAVGSVPRGTTSISEKMERDDELW